MASLLFALFLQRGISLGLFHEDPDFSYAPLLREIRAAGADHVAIVVPWYQHDVHATRIAPHPRFSAPASTVARTIRQARTLGLDVMVLPILRLEVARPGDWRGSIVPTNRTAWWRSYRRFILRVAQIAAAEGAALFCIGSELGTMDGDVKPWKRLARAVRVVFRGQLLYSANWDHLSAVKLWEVVDQVGVSAYFELAGGVRDPSVQVLTRAWQAYRDRLLAARRQIGKPLVITEVGYLSQDGTADRPWNEDAQEAIDLEEQRRCYEAFVRAWSGIQELAGVYFWNWYGWGGPESREYTPRGKPAVREICRFFGAKACPTQYGRDW